MFKKFARRSPPFDYQIRRSLRAKKTRIVVTGDKIEVVAPKQISEQKIHAFVHEQQAWVMQAVGKIQRRLEAVESMVPAEYRHGVKVPYRGQHYPLTIKASVLRRVKIEFVPETGFIAHLPDASEGESSELIRTSLMKWMRKQAAIEGADYVRKHVEKHNLKPRSLRIKTQKSRWGSCGIHDDINLNWLLIIAPPQVMEYVVVHELCHIRHRNHSDAFWQLVEDHMPDYRQRRAWLKQHGQSLMLGL